MGDTSSGGVIRSFTIIITQANEFVKPIPPERMQVILDRNTEKLWLSDDLSKQELLDLLQPFESAKMQAQPIPDIVDFPNPK